MDNEKTFSNLFIIRYPFFIFSNHTKIVVFAQKKAVNFR